jgi:dipeptidyl aminopeptidase/acylaminoacyl peptidase
VSAYVASSNCRATASCRPSGDHDGAHVEAVGRIRGDVRDQRPVGRPRRFRNPADPVGEHWSPDGRRILYQAFRGSNDDELYVVDATGKIRALTGTDAADEVGPAWSPDGSNIAYVRAKPGSDEDQGGVFVMSVGSMTVRQVTRGQPDMSPSWSPDGSRLTFTRGFAGDGTSTIHVMRSDGSHVRRLGRGDAPAWSPDGQTISFSGTATSG